MNSGKTDKPRRRRAGVGAGPQVGAGVAQKLAADINVLVAQAVEAAYVRGRLDGLREAAGLRSPVVFPVEVSMFGQNFGTSWPGPDLGGGAVAAQMAVRRSLGESMRRRGR